MGWTTVHRDQHPSACMGNKPFDGLEGSPLAEASASAGGFQRSVLSTERGWALILTSRLEPLACTRPWDLNQITQDNADNVQSTANPKRTNVRTTDAWMVVHSAHIDSSPFN